jgi:hypothetical protein
VAKKLHIFRQVLRKSAFCCLVHVHALAVEQPLADDVLGVRVALGSILRNIFGRNVNTKLKRCQLQVYKYWFLWL